MLTEAQKNNANVLFQAMRVQDVVSKAGFAEKTLNTLLHENLDQFLENPMDIAVLTQARQILSQINTNAVFDNLVGQMK